MSYRNNKRPELGPKNPPDRDGLLVEDFDDEKEDVHPRLHLLEDDEDDEDAEAFAAPEPKPGTYPKGINSKAKDIWDKVVKENSKKIDEQDDLKKKWAAAIVLFQRAAKDEGIKAFDKFPKKKSSASSNIEQTLGSSKDQAVGEIESDFKHLKRDGSVQRLTKLNFEGTGKRKGRVYIKLSKYAILRKGVDPEKAIRSLSDRGYKAGRKRAHKKIDKNAEILWEANGDRLVANILLSITFDQAVIFLDMEGAKQASITKKLAKVGRRWIKTGDLDPSKVSAHLARRGHYDLALAIGRITGVTNG